MTARDGGDPRSARLAEGPVQLPGSTMRLLPFVVALLVAGCGDSSFSVGEVTVNGKKVR